MKENDMHNHMLSEDNQNKVGSTPAYCCTLNEDEGTMEFTCPFCFISHTHSVDITGNDPYEPTFRAAHCEDISYHPGGYYVFYT